jgi:hypothetical protein
VILNTTPSGTVFAPVFYNILPLAFFRNACWVQSGGFTEVG